MARTLASWDLYSEDCNDGTGKFFSLPCADIGNLTYSQNGRRATRYLQEINNGISYILERTYQAPQNSAVIQVPEDEADWLKHLHESGCVTAFIRKDCKKTKLQYFGGVIINGENMPRGTANGLNSVDGVAVVNVPVLYDKRIELDLTATPRIADPKALADGNTSLAGVTYCDCPKCCELTCARIYRAWTTPVNDPPPSFVTGIEYSDDNGRSWTNIDLGDIFTATINFIHCYYGRLFVGVTGQFTEPDTLYYSDNPVCSTWSTDAVATLGNFFGPFQAMAHSGLKIYTITFEPFSQNYSVYRSTTNGETHEAVFEDTNQNVYRYIAAAGNVVAVAGDNGLISYSTNSGNQQDWNTITFTDPITLTTPDIVAIDLAIPDATKPSEAVLVIVTDDNRIYKASLPNSRVNVLECDEIEFRTFHDLCGQVPTGGGTVSVELIMDGRGLWYGRAFTDAYYYLFDHGDTCNTVTTSVQLPDCTVIGPTFTDDSAVLAVCPYDPSNVTIHGRIECV